MKLLFLIFHGFSESSGVSKKIYYQVKALRDCGVDVHFCYYDIDATGRRSWVVNDKKIIDLGYGKWAKIKKRIDFSPIVRYAKENQIDFTYIRSYHNANPFTIHFVKELNKANIRSVIEVPTYPYDQEYITLRSKIDLAVDKCFRWQLAKQLVGIVTFSEATTIFGQKTIRISNGIDFSAIRMKSMVNDTIKQIHLIGVAEVHFWHGFDRVIKGLAEYYKKEREYKVYFHIVGEAFSEREKRDVFEPIKALGLEEYVIAHGAQHGEALDNLFDSSDLGIGSLGRHRSNITQIKTLKNREYAARGIPFVYSEMDSDFDSRDYVFKEPADESPINIEPLIEFYHSKSWSPQEIRDSIQDLSWKQQMQKVINYLNAIKG
ncbi:glycosyltransferase family 1 protein [Parabacteroides sp. OttesenSCG-928-G07]|nr:glycosyltransferase family 1 protein [Parabacteroides sp. OttesenSCG-928-G21]MDL2277992.1 glycosyltransferase family 1 protein [Parabacteroides sp. OttesenSCG-928-G07]